MLSKPKGNSQGHGYSEKEGLGKTATVLKLNYRQIWTKFTNSFLQATKQWG